MLHLLACFLAVSLADVVKINNYIGTNCTGEVTPVNIVLDSSASSLPVCVRVDIEDRT